MAHRNRLPNLIPLFLLVLLLAACGGSPKATQAPASANTPTPNPTNTPAPAATDTALAPTHTPESEPTDTPAPEMSPDQKAAADLWQMLQEEDYKSAWTLTPGKGELYAGQGPHGMLLTTYLNEQAFNTYESKPGDFPDGSIIVKENYMPDKTLAAITVMVKKQGYDADHNDWFFTKFAPDGTVQAVGSPAGCVACHGSVRTNDYVFTFPVAPVTPPQVEATDEVKQKAADLWQMLQDAGYKDKWTLIPGKGEFYAGQGPHGMLLTTYLNEQAFNTYESKPGDFPDGSIIVKENYMPDKTLAAITVMVKEVGFAPGEGDWFWTKFAPDGSVQAAGQPAGCVSCHGSVRSNDYVFSFPVAPIPPEGPPPAIDGEDKMGETENPGTDSGQAAATGDETPPEKPDHDLAAALIQKGGCAGCHTIADIDGALGDLGPNWCDITKEYQEGSINLAFIREAITNPNVEVDEKYPANIMPQNFGELFTPEEINTLAAFIATMDCEQ